MCGVFCVGSRTKPEWFEPEEVPTLRPRNIIQGVDNENFNLASRCDCCSMSSRNRYLGDTVASRADVFQVNPDRRPAGAASANRGRWCRRSHLRPGNADAHMERHL